ncbi:hypothetical protein TNCV_1318411 [Trichonephila clavipes]|nr:hypothetical protein TNCV_1318411 [Trichonephila clavipes]
MLKHLRLDVFELQETKLPVRLINTTNERRKFQGHETTPLMVKGNIEDVSSEVDNEDSERPHGKIEIFPPRSPIAPMKKLLEHVF